MKHPLLHALLAVALAVPGAAAFAQVQAYTYGGAVVYAGPAPDYPAIAQLPDNLPVMVMGCVAGYSWCDVAAPDLRGWVYGGNIYPSYQGQWVPLVGYGAAIGVPVVGFSVGDYWGRYYRNRPWFGSQGRWINHAPPRPLAQPHGMRPPANWRPAGGANYRPQPGRAPAPVVRREPANVHPVAPAARPAAPDNARPAHMQGPAPRANPGPRPGPHPAPERGREPERR